MLPHVVKYASVFLLSMVKFFGGPVVGVSLGLHFVPTMLLTVGGMMTSVVIFSGVGRIWVRHQRRQRRLRRAPVFTRRARIVVKVYRRFGIGGIAFLTPILFSPIGGTVIATLLGVSRPRILLHMLWSAVFWGITLTLLVVRFSHLPIFRPH